METTCTSTAGRDVWERLWTQNANPAKDAARLQREITGPRWQRLHQHLKARFPEGTREIDWTALRCVELGAGHGDFSILLASQGAQVTLVDFSPTALAQARERFSRLGLSATYVQVDFLAPSIDRALRGAFDLAVSLGVVEHFRGQQRTQAIRAHADMLAPGGSALISVPYAACLPYRVWKAYLELRGWWPYGMEIPYTRRELARRARQSGLQVSACFTHNLWESLTFHWARGLFHMNVDHASRRSWLDPLQGLCLTQILQKPLDTSTFPR